MVNTENTENTEKQKKKNRRLMVQVALVIIPVFLIVIGVLTLIMYKNTVSGFLDIQNDAISDTLENLYNNSEFYQKGFIIDGWETMDPSRVEDPEFEDMIAQTYMEMQEHLGDLDEWMMSLEGDKREYLYLYAYVATAMGPIIDDSKKRYDSLFLIDINEPNLGFVFFAVSQNAEEVYDIGDRLDIDLDDHPVLKNMVGSSSDKVVFEKTTDFMGEGSRYIGYKPIVTDGKVRAVLGVSYNWKEFSQIMTSTVRITLIFGIGSMVLLLISVLVLLFFKAVSPIAKIQGIVRNYKNDKNSSEIAAKMSMIRSRNELGMLSEDISDMVREIDYYTGENIRLAGERERVSAELDMARNIQSSQLPCDFPAFPDRNEFDIYASMTPAKEVGGDFYDFFLIDEDHLALVIADVSGKGVPAALFMMISKMLINNFAMMGLSPSEVLNRANRALCEHNSSEMFVTVWLGVLEISTGKVTAANAGHEFPIIRRPGGSFELFREKHDFVVGGIKNKKYKQYEFTLEKGSTLFVYTDGVPEAADADMKMFGTDRLVEVLNRDPDASPEKLLKDVHEAVDSFVGDAPQFDDFTMLGIKIL
ncbi:MAG: serine/threonine-protein phosphatase [Ruminococcus sp.]|nr:serine/threonine-protein phosphatase [Ruminococcus sp.]